MRLSLALALALALSLPAQVPPDKALATMKAGDGLQVQLFAAEPMLLNPTSMDIDPFGRVWVAEAVNYRYKSGDVRKTGDRIVVLTDKDGDGKADESTTFYESKELHAPLGICIIPQLIDKKIGFRILVSQSPNILEFWDRDGDLKADGPPTVFLTGFHGTNHDHGVHKIQVGPDGKLYFTVGDEGVKDLQAADKKGPKFSSNRSDCQAGTVWRCDPDGRNLELVAHNFRNPYQVAVDSFGEIWTSDNDDDGNKQCRICVVYPGGNYGYWPRGPGESHWHQEQPGIVPNVLRTGFGSPTGLCFYEGSLLPEKFRGALIAADAGPREITAYHRKPKGAGYELDKTLLLTSTDTWFRPSDVSVAPDGSLFVADWYDPGVGGHGIGDFTRGRIYRIMPIGHTQYQITDQSMLGLLCSPCLASQCLAKTHYLQLETQQLTDEIGAELKDVKAEQKRARVAWCFAPLWNRQRRDIGGWWDALGTASIVESREVFRVRFRRESDQFEIHDQMVGERSGGSKAVARELLLAYRVIKSPVRDRIPTLALEFDGQDRFYLAALNIACGTDPKRRDEILKDFDKHFPDWNDKTAALVRELRPKSSLPRLEKMLADSKLAFEVVADVVECLAGYDNPEAGLLVIKALTGDQPIIVKASMVQVLRKNLPGKWKSLSESKELNDAITALLRMDRDPSGGLQLIAAAKRKDRLDDVISIALGKDLPPNLVRKLMPVIIPEAIRTLAALEDDRAVPTLIKILGFETSCVEAAKALGRFLPTTQVYPHAKGDALKALTDLLTSKTAKLELRLAALAPLASNRHGANAILYFKEKGELPADLDAEAGKLLRNSPIPEARERAKKIFAVAAKLDLAKLPAIADLAKKTGNVDAGRRVWLASFKGEAQCMKCHKVKSEGGDIGPDLSAIGKKASRENLFESILQPSKAIAEQYQTWKIETDGGAAVTGFIVKETPETITLRDANGKDHVFPAKGTERKKLNQSLMADDLAKALTEQELIDLVEYLLTLKDEK